MTHLDIAQQRLLNQRLASPAFEQPVDVVQWLGAVQSQDYAAAKWALGLRMHGAMDDAIEQAFAAGAILRTHVMRPTWHFVAPADIRWMLALTAPRVHAASAYQYRSLELDDAIFAHSNDTLAKALQGGRQLTRSELTSALKQAGIAADNLLRFTYLIMRAELDGVICSGARQGKQFTYALLEERAPQAKVFDRDEALAELSRRYFTSHGPATLQDFVWWSGLTTTDARNGLEMIKSQLLRETIDNQTYWFSSSMPPAQDCSQAAYLLPNYDEYIVGYTDRSAAVDAARTKHLDPRGNVLFSHIIVIDGRVVGTWKRTFNKDAVTLTPNLLTPLNEAETRAFAAAIDRYGAFLGKPVGIQV
jgi:hypothetical protein